MNWKEQLDDHLDDLVRVTEGEKVQFTQRDARQNIHNFISTEIIEKIVQDVESEPRMTTNQMARHLRRKWL